MRRTTRWNSALVAALLASGTGVLLEEPILLLLSIPAIVFAVYSHATAVPIPTLEIERTISADSPSHGEAVEVTVTLRNTGRQTLTNVSLADGVPRLLAVRGGSARHATVLEPGGETTMSYTVVAKHGIHRFEPAAVVCRDTSGSTAVGTTVEPETETVLACRSPIQSVTFGRLVHTRPGTTVTAVDGSGTEFSNVRAYRPGDRPSRIDWNRYARERELTTVRFREERAQPTVLCLDARQCCYRAATDGDPHAVAYERFAARELLDAAADSNEPVGLSVLGTGQQWMAPKTGSRHIATVRRTLADPETLPLEPPTVHIGRTDRTTGDEQGRELRTRIGRQTGVLLLSPLLDEVPVELARTLQAEGNPVTVLSPDVTAERSLGTAVARVRRRNRIATLRRAAVPVVDWDPETPLESAMRAGVNR
ncbi:hypothetical protein BBD46_10485 [Natrialba sp. SSL1]|nr:hypothetical protein BBD46_10485 [Natrialba sp. SSL1]